MTVCANSDDSRDLSNSRVRSIHDIKASLAISNGFSQALETALSDLHESYVDIVHSTEATVSPELLQQLRKHENDCKFCLSRLSSSLSQLKTRIDCIESAAPLTHSPETHSPETGGPEIHGSEIHGSETHGSETHGDQKEDAA